jgi:alpha-L-fucosidase
VYRFEADLRYTSAAAEAAAAKPWLHGEFDTFVNIRTVQARLRKKPTMSTSYHTKTMKRLQLSAALCLTGFIIFAISGVPRAALTAGATGPVTAAAAAVPPSLRVGAARRSAARGGGRPLPGAAASTEPPRQPSTSDPQKEQRLRWFRQAKYGLFIHWGLYAIPAGEWQGKRTLGLGEWIMFRAPVPVREYEKLASQFNPVKYNADEWVTLAKDAGMKYIVITSKHHDGFALFKSAASPYNVVDATPFKRDILKELADACARQGMRLGFYYSQSQDWHEPNGAGNTWDFPPDEKKDYDQYLRGKAEPQIRELLTGYGPVALIWFDTPRMMTGDRPHRFTRIVRSMQPDTLIDGRLGAEGDYVSTGDNVIPPRVSANPWEVPATINHTWGYRKDDTDWKSPGQITFKLIDIVSKGGNYLLNVGPMADGVIPQASQDILRTVGRWLRVNGEAVYGADPTPFGEELGEPSARGARDVRGDALVYQQIQWRVTSKPGKLYFTFFDEPRAPFAVPAIRNTVKRAYRLADKAPVDMKMENGRAILNIERPIFDPMATVIVVEFDGEKVDRVH